MSVLSFDIIGLTIKSLSEEIEEKNLSQDFRTIGYTYTLVEKKDVYISLIEKKKEKKRKEKKTQRVHSSNDEPLEK